MDLLPLLIASLILFLLHPAAMWTGYRTARWVGTRTLPLVFAGAGITLAIVLLLQAPGWWLLALFPLVVIVWYAITVHAAWHAFAHQTFLPSVASGESMSASRAIGLFVACVVLLTTIGVMTPEMLFPRSQLNLTTYDLEIDRDGDPWEIQNVYREGTFVVGEEAEKLGRRVTIDQPNTGDFAPLPADWTRAYAASFNHYGTSHWYDRFGYIGQVTVGDSIQGYCNLVVYEGQILVYVRNRGVTQLITPDGVFDPDDNSTGRFHNVKLLSNTTSVAKVHSTCCDRLGFRDHLFHAGRCEVVGGWLAEKQTHPEPSA